MYKACAENSIRSVVQSVMHTDKEAMRAKEVIVFVFCSIVCMHLITAADISATDVFMNT